MKKIIHTSEFIGLNAPDEVPVGINYSPLTQYIEERIVELRKEKDGLKNNITEHVMILYGICELQAVLSKIEEIENK